MIKAKFGGRDREREAALAILQERADGDEPWVPVTTVKAELNGQGFAVSALTALQLCRWLVQKGLAEHRADRGRAFVRARTEEEATGEVA